MEKISFWDCDARIGQANNPINSKWYSTEHLLAMMDSYEVDRALVYHKEALNNPENGNALLLPELCKSDRLIGCAVLAPPETGEFGDIDRYFDMLRESGVRAIRLFPVVHHYLLKRFCLDAVLENAARHHMPVLIDEFDPAQTMAPVSTWTYRPSYAEIYELAQAYPSVNFIVILPGMLTLRLICSLLSKCSNVYLECSTFGYRHVEFLSQKFSASRLLYGSYWPVLEPGAYMSYILYADIDRAEKEQIAAKNLEHLLWGGTCP